MYGGIVGFAKEDIIKVEKDRGPEPTGKKPSKKPDLSLFPTLVKMVERSLVLFNEIQRLQYKRNRNEITEPELIASMRRLCIEINAIYMKSADLPFLPADLKEYDQITQNIFTSMDIICEFYSKRGLKKWPERNRKIGVNMQIKDLHREIQRLSFAKKRVK